MNRSRIRRVAGQIKKETSHIIREGLKDPRISTGITSITDVLVSPDLRYARIYVSILGSEEDREEILRVLDKATGFIRSEIGKRIRLRYVPEISFIADKSIEYGAHIDQVLKDLGRKHGEGED